MKKTTISTAFICAFLFTSCVTIPEEAVHLNEEIGKNIAAKHSAYMNLLNYYFFQRRARIDAAMDRYRMRLMENIQSQGVTEIPLNQMEKLLDILSARRDSLHEQLEQTRIVLVDQINKDHQIVMQANANVTALLQSAVDIDKGTRSLTTKTFESIGVDLKLDQVTSVLDEQLIKAGDVSAGVVNVSDQIRSLFQPKEN